MIYTNIDILSGPPDDDYETIPAEDAVTETAKNITTYYHND